MLIDYGYIEVKRVRDKGGSFGKNVYTIKQTVSPPTLQFEGMVPTLQIPCMDNPSMDIPGMENERHLIITALIITVLIITVTIITIQTVTTMTTKII